MTATQAALAAVSDPMRGMDAPSEMVERAKADYEEHPAPLE
jgi:hypothetical protein